MLKNMRSLLRIMQASALAGLICAPSMAAQLKLQNIEIDGKSQSVPATLKNTDNRIVHLLNSDRANVQIEAQIRFKRTDGSAGFVLRTQSHDLTQGYQTGLDAKLQKAFISKGSDIISDKGMPLVAGHWYQLKLQVQNNHFVMYVANQMIKAGDYPAYDAVDSDFSAGQLGVYSSGSDVEIRNINVTPYQPVTAQKTYTNPVELNCADPGMLKHQGTYYAYCTYTPDFPMMKRGIRLYTSTDMVNWQDRGFALLNQDSWGTSRFWAPDIVEKQGTFYLYYAVDERIAVATASSPLGPFVQKTKAPMLPDSIKIDAHVFTDDDGKRYFYYVGFDNGNHIWGAELNQDMVSIKQNTMTHLIAPTESWETHMANVAEGPMVIKHKGLYYMTYSGSHFESPYYSVGYAVAEHPLGPWKKYEFNPIMRSTTYAHGTAHHTLTTSPDGKEMFIVYHQHYSLNQTEPRKIAIDRIRFVPQENGPDKLEIWGPTVTPQPLPSGDK